MIFDTDVLIWASRALDAAADRALAIVSLKHFRPIRGLSRVAFRP
jgi:hypothetical protein